MPARSPTAVDDTRRARETITAGGFETLRQHLGTVRVQYRSRTGPFVDLPTERPADVQRAIDAVDSQDGLLDELRSLRKAVGRAES